MKLNLKAIREERGLTLGDLSEITKISKSNLSVLESGKGNPTLKTIILLSKKLQIPICFFIECDCRVNKDYLRIE